MKLKKLLKYIISISILWFVTHEIFMILDGLNDDKEKADIAVIFGNKVNEDGTLSERLKARLNRGIKLYKDSLVKHIFVSGGLGSEGFYEGDKMYEYLIQNKIPESIITIDNKGNNTALTTSNFIKVFGKNKSVYAVSQFYHISRAKLSFRKNDIENVYGAHCYYYELRDFYSCFREFFGYYKYLIF